MKISIITIVLNSERTISNTIESVINQNYSNFEYIIIDGGSTDKTLSIIEKYSSSINIMISEPDNGISDAFNKGIKLSSGDIIGIVSSDDILLPNSLERLALEIKNNPQADVIFGNALVNENKASKSFIVKPDPNFEKIWIRQPIKHASMFVKRSVYEKHGLFDCQYRYAMDYELVLRYFLNNVVFLYSDFVYESFGTHGVNANNPIKTIGEVRDISIRYGYPKIKAYKHFIVKAVIMKIKQIIFQLRLDCLVDLYRKSSKRFNEIEK